MSLVKELENESTETNNIPQALVEEIIKTPSNTLNHSFAQL